MMLIHPEKRSRAGALVLALLVLSGCHWLDELRASFNGGVKPPGPEGSSALVLDVDPATGIEIRIDETLVSRNSPYRVERLGAGEHRLVVSADGYHAFATPVTLSDHQTVALEISLRRKTAKAKPSDPPPTPAAPEAQPPH